MWAHNGYKDNQHQANCGSEIEKSQRCLTHTYKLPQTQEG